MKKVKICFDCKKYCWLTPGTYESVVAENSFNAQHVGHRTQIVSQEEFIKWRELHKEEIKNGRI